jgi:hypothetical protein
MDVIEESFAKLKLLKVFDFYKTRVLAREQQGWVQFICDRYLNASPYERESIHSLVTPETSFLFFMYAGAVACWFCFITAQPRLGLTRRNSSNEQPQFQLCKPATVYYNSRLALRKTWTLQHLVIRRGWIQRAISPTYRNSRMAKSPPGIGFIRSQLG